MISLRLTKELQQQLEQFSEQRNSTKTQVVREALAYYFAALEEEQAQTPYVLGEALFGKYASGATDNSVNYKQKIKEKLRAKNTD